MSQHTNMHVKALNQLSKLDTVFQSSYNTFCRGIQVPQEELDDKALWDLLELLDFLKALRYVHDNTVEMEMEMYGASKGVPLSEVVIRK